ncbi:cobyrinate a,c-diamide synthase [Comamonas sp. JUb58]|uniref:cobyrinate a,c-diamide synthase n=1 Tax=Comamonas sp. JUb58 TaxID=2485114 RepID=UPI001FBB0C6A|nr:cobyrinate a,c-diamide synthase [Comamonas sp. JUb58]
MTVQDHSMASCVALLIAAPASGQGKTTVTAALARLHARQGRRVQVFKCGPDFLDPQWLRLASGQPVHALDRWMNGEADVRARLFQAAQSNDVLLIEGVMGLFDGANSAAELAKSLGISAVVVVDASAMAATFGAIAHGLQHYDPGLQLAGVLANRVATAHHGEMLRSGLRDPALWLGAMHQISLDAAKPRANLLPERHLGLVAAHELHDAAERLDAAADVLAQTPLGQLDWQEWQQRWTVAFTAPAAAAPVPAWLAGRRIAVARDAAFSFIYTANLECLQAMGAELAFFSPIAGERLPACDALWLPGGYPELHLQALKANAGVQLDLQAHLEQRKPVWAECGGMVALAEGLTDLDSRWHSLWGLLPAQAVMQQRLAGLGMQQLLTPWGMLRGHTFHYSKLQSEAQEVARSSRPGQAAESGKGEAVYQQGSIHASYFHAWFPSCPQAVAALLGVDMPVVDPQAWRCEALNA